MWQGGWRFMILEVPSNPGHSVRHRKASGILGSKSCWVDIIRAVSANVPLRLVRELC